MSTTQPQLENGTDDQSQDANDDECLCATTDLGCFEHFQGGPSL